MSNNSLIASIEYSMKENQAKSSGFSVFDFGEKAWYSAGAAVTSAVAGFYNTGVSVANIFRDNDIEMADTGDWVNKWMGGEAADFYEEHDDFIDIAGLIAGSFVPGGLAVKGLRGAQAGLRSAAKLPPASIQKGVAEFAEGVPSVYSRMTTGLKNTLVPKQELDTLTKAIRSGNHSVFSRQDYLKLAKEGLHQNLLEAAVYETATVLTMAKHSSLSDEDLNYFESLGQAKGDLGFGIVFGGALGTLGSFAGAVAKSKSAFREAAAEFNPYAFNQFKHVNATEVGDALVDDLNVITDKKVQISELEVAIKELTADGKSQELAKAENKLRLAKDALGQANLKFMEDINNAIPDKFAREKFIAMSEQTGTTPEKMAEIFAGAINIKTIAKGGNLKNAIDRFTLDFSKSADEMEDLAIGQQFNMTTGKLEIPAEELSKMDNDDILDYFDQLPPMVNARHSLKRIEKTKLYEDMTKEMDRFNRAEYKAEYEMIDLYKAKLDNITDPAEIEELSVAMEAKEAMLAKKSTPEFTMEKMLRLLNNADNDTYNLLKKDYPTLHHALNKSRAIQEQFGPTRAYIELDTGRALRNDAVVPFAADLGNLKFGNKFIEIDQAKLSYEIDVVKPITQMSVLEATAKYAMAEQEPMRLLSGYTGAMRGTEKKVIDTFDLVRTNAALTEMKKRAGVEPISVRYKNTKGQVVEYSDYDSLATEVIKAKREATLKLSKMNRFSKKHIAAILDTDESWVNGGHVLRGKIEKDKVFRGIESTEENYFNRARYLQVDYHKDFTTDAHKEGLLQMEKRINDSIRDDDLAFAAHMGDDSELFPVVDPTKIHGAMNTTSFVAAHQAEWGEEQFKAIGSILSNRATKNQKAVYDVFGEVAARAVANSESVAEINVVQNLARQNRYYYYKTADDAISTELVRTQSKALMQLMEVSPEYGHTIKRALADALGLATKVKPGTETRQLLHRDVVSKFRNLVESMEASIKFNDKGLGLTEDSFKAIDGLLKDAKAQVIQHSDTIKLGELKSYTFKNKATADLYDTWVGFNDKQMQARRTLAKRNGSNISYEERMLWAGPLDTSMYDYVAFVDFKNSSKVYGTKNRGVIVAKSQADLDMKKKTLLSKFGEEIEVTALEKSEDRLRALEAYDSQLAITDNVVDSTMSSKGVLWEVMTEYNPNVVQEMLNAQIKASANLDRGYVGLKYQREFAEMSRAEKVFIEKGKIDKAGRAADAGPWKQQIRAALNLPNTGDHEWYISAQEKVSEALGKAFATTRGLFIKASDSNLDAEWKRIDKYLERTGLPRPYSEVSDYIKTNSNVSPERMEAFVGKLNAMASTVMLRLDQTQALVNSMSMPIMLMPEMQQLRKYISGEAAKKLDDLTSTTLQQGMKEPTNMKLAFGAATEFWTAPNRKELVEAYKKQGIVGNTLHELQSAAEAISLRPNMDEGSITKGAKKLVQLAATPADKAEEFVKFTAARSAEKILELVPEGVIPESQKWAIIRNFVDKVHGNYVASQRPTMFKGFAGQAIGLFQTYQFNLYQRLFAHLGSDSKRMAMTMIGTQAGIFGAQSLPGFQLLNDHIAKKSSDHKNIYSSAREEFGDNLSEWLIYGTGSNIFKPIPGLGGIDLYSRGDLTPRTPILVPTSLEEIPVVSMTRKFVGSMTNALAKSAEAMSAGADPAVYQTIALEALAHWGINRPIAGISQMALGYRTTNSGKLLMTYDDDENLAMTWAVKAMGAKGLDEAIAVNQYYKALQYRTKRYEKLDHLGQTFRDSIRSNNGKVAGGAYMHFMEEYVANGGNQEDYSRWVQNQVAGANDSIINELRNKNSSPEGRYLQGVMGGAVDEF